MITVHNFARGSNETERIWL